MPSTVQSKMGRGAVWMISIKWVVRGLGFVSTLILVRLLAPSDFGLVAMAMAFITFTELLSAFGFDVALIHDQSAGVDRYNSAWTANWLLGIVIAALMLALAVPVSIFFGQPELTAIVGFLALGPFVAGFENIGVVAFRKDLEFHKEFMFQVSRKVFSFVVTITLAFVLRSYWALVFGILASKVSGTILSYWVHPFRPRMSVVELRPLLKFSRWLLLYNVVSFLKERSTDFFIGRGHGANVLGIYNISFEFACLPSHEVGAPINRALLPGFAKLAGKTPEVGRAFTNFAGLIALVAVPIGLGTFATAPYIVPVLLGPKWLSAVPVLEILTIHSSIVVFHGTVVTALIALGHPRAATATNFVFVLILIIGLAVFSGRYGAVGAAFATLGACILTTPLYLLQLRQLVGVRLAQFFAVICRPVLAGVVMAAVIRVLVPPYSTSMPAGEAAIFLVFAVAGGAFVYFAGVAGLWLMSGRPAGAERTVLSRLEGQQNVLFKRLRVSR